MIEVEETCMTIQCSCRYNQKNDKPYQKKGERPKATELYGVKHDLRKINQKQALLQ